MDEAQKNATAWVSRLVSTLGRGRTGTDVPTSPFNVLVYRVSSRERWTRRQLSSTFGRKSFFHGTGLSFKQWLLVFFEMFLSLVWWVIHQRRKYIVDLNRQGITERQQLIDLYLRRACSSFVSLLVGYLADTYFNMYAIAIFNVILYFATSALLFMEQVLRLGDYDQYQDFFFQAVGIALILLKATDFARLVFGLQNLSGRKTVKTAILFIFYTVWLNERSVDGIVVTVVSRLELHWETIVWLSFVLSGASLATYIYVFRPLKENFVISRGPVGNDFIGCIVTALRTRRLKSDLTGKEENWLDYAEIKYEKVIVNRTRDLLKLYCLILPTFGFSLYSSPRCDFYMVLWDRLVPSGFFVSTGIRDGAAIVTMLSMGILQFVFIPIAERAGVKRAFLPRFIIGYFCALICIWYTTGILQALEEDLPSPTRGMVRIFNARDDPVRLTSQDQSITYFDRVAKPREEVKLTLELGEETLFKVRIAFPETNLTTYLSAQPDVMVGYLLLEPATIVKMGEKLPVRELTAGNNDARLPKLYVFNALTTSVTVEFGDLRLGVYKFTVVPGAIAFRQVPPGIYQLRTLEFESNGVKNISMQGGGFYGVIAHTSSLETLLTADILILNRRLDSVYILGVCIPYGFALALAYVTLRCMVFINTPEGMEGLSFGFLEFVDSMTYWLFWMGYKTWHPFITSYCLWMYSIIELLLMFGCIFVFIKFGGWYKFQ